MNKIQKKNIKMIRLWRKKKRATFQSDDRLEKFSSYWKCMPPKFFNSVELTNYNAQKLYQAIHNQCLKKKAIHNQSFCYLHSYPLSNLIQTQIKGKNMHKHQYWEERNKQINKIDNSFSSPLFFSFLICSVSSIIQDETTITGRTRVLAFDLETEW